jgi:hypothetical protein
MSIGNMLIVYYVIVRLRSLKCTALKNKVLLRKILMDGILRHHSGTVRAMDAPEA